MDIMIVNTEHYADYNLIIIFSVCLIISIIVCSSATVWRLVRNSNTRMIFWQSSFMKLSVIVSAILSIALTSSLSYYLTIMWFNGYTTDTGDGCIWGSILSLLIGVLFTSFFVAGAGSIGQINTLRSMDYTKIYFPKNATAKAQAKEKDEGE